MIDLGSVVVPYGDRGVVEGGQQVLLDVPHLGGVVIQAVKHKADVTVIQLQQAGLYHRLGKLIPGYPEGLPFGADRLHHQLHHLVQLARIPWVLPHEVVIADVLPDQFPVSVHFRSRHRMICSTPPIPSLRFLSFPKA